MNASLKTKGTNRPFDGQPKSNYKPPEGNNFIYIVLAIIIGLTLYAIS